MKDIILINLPTNAWYKKEFSKNNVMPPLGLMYIATVLQNNHFDVDLIDFSVTNMKEHEFTNYILSEKPKIVGISTYAESWLALKVISAHIKSLLPTCLICAGGAFATFTYRDVLSKSHVDIISTGEGELSILALCNSVIHKQGTIPSIPGLIIKTPEKKVICTGISKRITDLDSLPFVNRELVDASKYNIPYTISTSRGCPGGCIFCSSKSFWGSKIYMRSASNIVAEIMEIYTKYKSNVFQISDDTFTASKKRAIDVCSALINSGIQFIWGCESRADVITEDFARLLKKAGCNKIQIGLESADNQILKSLNKYVTIEQIENALKILSAQGFFITLSFIVGHADDTTSTIKKTIDFAIQAKEKYGAAPAISVNTPFPGTPQYSLRHQLGITIYNTDWNEFRLDNPNISTRHLTLDQIRQYYYMGTREMRKLS